MTPINQRILFEKLQPFLPPHLIYRLADDITYNDALAISIHIRLLRGVIATYLPRYLSQMIAAEPIPGQVRGLFQDGAVIFADISGFTAMSEELSALGKEGAEEITGIVNDYFETMLDIGAAYGGDLLKFSGDALLLFFEGDAGAHRAIATALAMQQAMSRFSRIKTSRGTFALRMSIGIGCGPVFLANLGTVESMEHTVMGRAVASMMQAEDRAGAGQIIVDQAAYNQTRHIAAFASAGDGFWLLDQTTPFSPPAQAAPPPAESVQLFQNAKAADLLADSLAQVTVINGLRPFIPETLLTRLALDPQNPTIAGGHRPVTAMFVNFFGVEAIIDTLGPEYRRAITQILNIYFVSMSRILARYGGVVNKIDTGPVGYRMMALFGALRAHEDDPQRAVRAALEINRAMPEVNYQINDILQALPIEADFADAPLKQRIGINTGFVFVGNVGSAHRREYSVMGDEVNLTARLTAAATEGEILISSSTRRHVRDEFTLTRRPPLKLKGKSHPVDNFVVTGIRKRPDRWANLASSPIVGRDTEIEQGRAAIDRARQGSGSLLVVKGESGIGKTRLVEEIAFYAEESGIDLLVGSCLSYGSTLIYHPWADILRTYFNIQPGDGMAARLEAVRQGMADIGEEVWSPVIGDVLGLEIPDNDLTRTLDAKLRRQRTLDLTVKLLQMRARLTPLVVVVEDTHWADPASMDLINYVARNISYDPIVLILPHRPDAGLPNWADAPHAVDLTLTELSDDAAMEIVRGMIGDVDLSDSMRQMVLSKGGGIPFFIEEVVRVLIDSGAFQQDDEGRWQVVHDMTAVDLPDTIHGMIIGRIDRLLEMDRRILQAASVIGRVFGYRLLDGTYSYTHGEPLQQRLNYMGHLGLTELQSVDASLYRFKHLTTRDVVYESLSFEQRRALHRRIAAFIERTFADTLSEQTNLLAYHYFEGQEWPKAVKYNMMTARQAQREFANDIAVTSYKRTLNAIEHLDEADVTPEITMNQLTAHESLGDVLTLLGQYDEALENFAAARAVLVERQPPSGASYRRLADLCRKTADVFEKRSQYDTAFEWLQKGLSTINQTVPTIEAARIYLLGAGVYQRQGKNDEAINWCEKSLSVASKIKTVEGSQAVGQAYYLLGLIYNRYGDLRRAIQFCAESVQVYQKIGDIVGQSQAYLNLANVYSDQGDWEMAGQALQQSLDVKKKIGDIFYEGAITNNLANLYLYRGEWDKSIELFAQSRAVWQQLGAIAPEAVTTSNLAQVYIYQQNWAEAEACLTRSEALFATIESEDFLSELERRWAEFYLKTGHLPDALSHIQHSLALADKHDARLELGMSYRVQGMIHLARENSTEARTSLEKSLEILSDLNSEYECARTKLALARLLASDSRPEAETYLQQATDTFQKLGAQADLAEAQALLS